MALADWDQNKSLRLEIDYSKIDETLTNFPVMITLGSVCGSNSFDAAALFDDLGVQKYKIAVEYVPTGEQCYVEVERWYYATNSSGVEMVWLGSTPEGERCSVSSIYSASYPATEAWDGVITSTDTNRWLSAAGTFNTTTGEAIETTWFQWDFPYEMSTKGITKIRYMRSATNATLAPKNVTLKASDTGSFSGEETTVCSLEWAAGAVSTWSDLLTISGTANKRYLRAYIDAIFPSNVGYGGVANWELTVTDYVEHEAILWVKVPSISYTETTYLRLYYDFLHDDNTQYVYALSDLSTKGNYTTTKGTSETSEAAQNKRIIIDKSYLTTFVGAGKVRVCFEAHTNGYTIDSCYIGAASSTGDAYDFESTPTAVTFKGSTSVAVGGLYFVFSDWIDYEVDDSKNLIVSFHHETFTMWYKTSPAGITSYYKAGTDESSTVDVSSYSTGNLTCLVSVEECMPSPQGRVWDDNYVCVYHTSQAPNGVLKDSTNNKLDASPTGMIAEDWVTGPSRNTRAITYETTATRHDTDLDIPIMGSERRTFEYFASSLRTTVHGYFRTGSSSTSYRWAFVHQITGTTNRSEYYANYETYAPTAVESSPDFVYYVGKLDGTTVENSRFYVNNEEQTATGGSGLTATVTTSQTALRIGTTMQGSTEYGGGGFLYEFRISNIARSAAWSKASYYSGLDQLVSISEYHLYELNGYVQLQGVPVVRTIYLYNRENGRLIDSAVSSGVDGKFSLYCSTSGTVFITIMPELTDSYNIIAQDKIVPIQLV